MSGSITLAQYYMGRDAEHAAELTAALRDNAAVTVARVNRLLAHACIACEVTSGWRPHAVNAKAEASSRGTT